MRNKKTSAFRRFYDWQTKANDDFRAMEVMLKEGGLPNPICFHAQQGAEKYLKGFLVFHFKKFSKTHSLIHLLDGCKKIDQEFQQLEEEVLFLDTFYIETRYPGDYPSFSMKDGREAYQAALRVKDFVLGKIG